MKKVLQSIVLLLGVLMLPTAAYAQDIYADVNGDLEVNIGDINAVIDVILSDINNPSADVNGDGEINIGDINAVIDIILGGTPKKLCSTIFITTRDGVTMEYLLDDNTRLSIEKPNLVIETDGKVLTYELENMARLRYGQRYVSAGLSLDCASPLQEESVSTDVDERPQYALFTYRNDGGMNAFLNIDVDSITYSNTGLDGVSHPNAVVQQVWTPDSLYRIPLAVIDSVGFKAPQTEYKPDVVIIDERHMPYIIDASDSTITFNSDVPSSMVPVMGQIMYSDLTDDPFYMGFAGRVVGIERRTGQVKYICSPVTPSDVYSRFLDCFKVITDSTEVVDDTSGPSNAPKKSWAFIATDGTVRIPEHTWDLSLNLNKIVGGEGNIKDSGKIENEFYYLICVGMLDHDFITLKHTKKITNTAKASLKVLKTPTPALLEEPLWGEPVSLVGCKYLGVNLYPGLFFDADASLELEAKLPYSSNQVDEYYFGSDLGWSNPLVTSDDEGGWPGWSDFLMNDDASVKIKVSGKVAFGPIVKAAIVVWKPNSLSFDVRAKGGLELSGECSFDVVESLSDESVDVYDDILSNLKLTTGLKVGLELHGKAFGEDCTFFGASSTLFKQEKYLFPKFTAPTLPQYQNGTWQPSVTPTSMYTVPSQELLLPGKVGLGVYDQNGTCLRNSYYGWYFGTEDDWPQSAVQCSLAGLEAGREYVVRPLYKMLDLFEIKGGPRTVFCSPEPMSLEKPTLQLIKGTRGDVAICGGWGYYTASCTNDKVTATVVSSWVNGAETFLVRVEALSPGNATINVKDVRTGDVVSLPVTVIEGENLPLYVAEECLDFGVVPAGMTSTKVLTLINNTTSAKTVTATVDAPFSFTQGNSSVSSLTVEVPAQSCGYVAVTFTASGTGASNGNVTFANELFENGKCTVPVQAYASSSDDRFYIEQHSLDLGEVSIGETRTGTLTIVNNSVSPQTVTATIDAPFSFSYNQSSMSELKLTVPGSSCSTITVLYTATDVGTVSGNITFTAEALQGGTCVIPVQATTTADGQSLYIEQQSLDLGDVLTGETRTGELTIINNTAAAKTVTATIDAPFSFSYNQSSMSSLTLEVPGNACSSVTVMFTATTPGDYSGNVTFQNSAFDGGQSIVPVHARAVTGDQPQTEVITIPDTDVSFKMVAVEGGTFTMGATAEQGSDAYYDEYPAHRVTVSSFSIGQTEVTQDLWQAVMGSNPSYFSGDLSRPVEQVSWDDCQTFITKLNELTGKQFRLPTEAEWEYAARGGNQSQGYKFAGSNTIGDVAWYYDNSYALGSSSPDYGTHAVATKSPNELGLYDMTGNVYEWCQDWYSSSYYSNSPSVNPTGPTAPTSGSGRVFRGGGWSGGAVICRVSDRSSRGPSLRIDFLGLRLAL